MKKIRVVTVLLIIISAYLLLQVCLWYNDKVTKWDECQNKGEELLTKAQYDNNGNQVYNPEYERSWDSYNSCLESYGDIFMMFEIMGGFLILSIFMAILSWRLDNLKN